MERNQKTAILKYSAVFVTAYVLIWLFPGLVVYPADYLIELYRGVEYVDGWTPGFMVWAGALVVIPVLFIMAVLRVFFRSRGKKHE